jgi:ribokinase
MSLAQVVVLGSANCDLVLSVDRLPMTGETLLARGIRREPGGKGANQAVAAARAGAATTLLGAVGRDREAELLRSALIGAGVDVSPVRIVDESSGLAVVMVDGAGENSIVVAAGANRALGSLTAADRACIAGARVLLCQLEVPVAAVMDGARTARENETTVVLNAAPSMRLPDELWDLLDVLVVNEHEADDLGGGSLTLDQAIEALLVRVPVVVVTLGAKGARLASRDGTDHFIAAPAVAAVDTTGAGDAFCGAFAAAMAAGEGFAAATEWAAAAASLSVQRHGSITSMPSATEIDLAQGRR